MIKVTCAVIVQHDKVLITQRGEHPEHAFQWEFPGGKVNPGEAAENCISREIKEELNLEIQIVEPLQPVYFDYGFKSIELIPFLCRIKSGEIKLSEHIDFCWEKWPVKNTGSLLKADRQLLMVPANKRLIEKHIWKKVDNAR